MKKLLTALCALITFTMVTVFCFTGCSAVTTSDKSNKENPWIEIQSITYSIKDGEEKTLISTLYRNVTLLYSKFFIESYELRYVKIRFVDNGGMEINYYETSDNLGFTTINVLPVSYEITYFKD